MTRRCSHCGHNGHNSRTCPDRGIRLFGVRLTLSKAMDSSGIAMRKSASAGNLLQHQQQPAAAAGGSTPEQSESGDGYGSDGLVQASSYARAARKKGVPWSEEEHRLFLVGLHALGKGDWRGISRNYVTSRAPTQVASHAQKYFIRQSNLTKRKRRSSLFDIPPEAMDDTTGSDPRPHLPPLAPQEDKESISSSASPPSSFAGNSPSRRWLAMSTCSPPSPAALDKIPGPPRKQQTDEQEPELTRLSLGSANLGTTSAPKPIRVV